MTMTTLSSVQLRIADFVPELWAAGGEGGDAERPPESRRLPRSRDAKRDDKDHRRNFRRNAGISAYIGQNGSGKSAAMVFDTITTLRGMPWRC